MANMMAPLDRYRYSAATALTVITGASAEVEIKPPSSIITHRCGSNIARECGNTARDALARGKSAHREFSVLVWLGKLSHNCPCRSGAHAVDEPPTPASSGSDSQLAGRQPIRGIRAAVPYSSKVESVVRRGQMLVAEASEVVTMDRMKWP